MTGWAELVGAALLGTERREPPATEAATLAGAGPAPERLLRAAAALAVKRRAGRLAAPAPELGPPAPAESLEACGAAAAARLPLLLDADRRPLLPEWLRAAAAQRRRAPPEWLPELLTVATADAALRAPAEDVIGERGRWLAATEPRWAWAAPLPATERELDALWRTGPTPQRRRVLLLLRGEQPEAARELLEAAWDDEGPEDRAALLTALADGLSRADEPLLERGLDDRRREVRDASATLLATLPGSDFGARMTTRTLPLVRLARGPRPRLRVTLPEALDSAAERDGIRRKPPKGRGGARAWWLTQLIASTPLAAWAALDLDAQQAATLAANDGLELPLRKGFAAAALAQGDPTWAVAFLRVDPQLAELAGPESTGPVAIDRLRRGVPDPARRLPAPWGRAISEQALDFLGQFPRLLAERLDPALAQEAAHRLGAAEPGTAAAREADDAITTLTFRQAMHEELR